MVYRGSRKFGSCWLILKRSALGEVEALGDTLCPRKPPQIGRPGAK